MQQNQGQGMVKGSLYMLLGGVSATGLRYAFQILAARWLGAADFGVISNLFSWILTIVGLLSSGTSIAMVRYIAQRKARGWAAKPVIRSGAIVQGVLVAGLLALGALFGTFLADRLFEGSRFLLIILLGGIVGHGLKAFLLGVLRGFRQFRHVAVTISVMPAARLAFAALLGVALGYGVEGVAWAILLAPVSAIILAAYWSRRLVRGDTTAARVPLPLSEFISLALPATIMTGITRFLPRSGTILTNLLATENVDETVGLFTAALVLARLPELLIESLNGPLLSNFSRANANNDRALLRQYVTRSTQLIGGTLLLYMLGMAALGPRLIPLIYGKQFWFPRLDLVLLVIGTGFYTMAQIHSQIVLVKRGAAYVAWTWVFGAIVLVALAVVTPRPLFRRIETSYILANGLVAGILTYQSYRSIKESA